MLVPAGFMVSHHFTGLTRHESLAEGPGKGSVLALHLITPTDRGLCSHSPTVTQEAFRNILYHPEPRNFVIRGTRWPQEHVDTFHAF